MKKKASRRCGMILIRDLLSCIGQRDSGGTVNRRRRKGKIYSEIHSSLPVSCWKWQAGHLERGSGTTHLGPVHRCSQRYNTRPCAMPRLTKDPFWHVPHPGWARLKTFWKGLPGPNGLPYKLYKNCSQVTKIWWKLMRIAWKKQLAPFFTPFPPV